jgi:hypothetical protein
MNKIIFLSILLSSILINCHAQKIEERAIPAFNKIKISGALNVIYTNSDTLNLIVKAKEKEINNIETRVENSTLIISNKGKFASPVYVYVKNNQLQSVESTGATDFRTTNAIKTDSLVFNVSGASEVHAKIETKKLRCQEDGASSVVFEGTTDYLDADVSSAASLKSYNLVAKNAVVMTSGAASARVYVTEKLNATAQSASDIKVKGDPKDVTAETSTAANITRIKETSKNTDSEGDTTTYNFRKKKILYINNSYNYHKTPGDNNEAGFKHWRGFSIAVNGYMKPGGGLRMPDHYRYMDLDYRKSFNFQFNIIERQICIVKNKFKIITGLGFDYHLYEFANKTRLNADSSFTNGVIDTTNKFSYKKNKLRATYIQVPLLLEFNTSNDPEKTFHLAFGIIGQFLLTSRTKQVLEEGKDETTHIRKDSYNMSPFAAKAHVNLGYRCWTFFGEYSLNSLFQSGKGPEVYPFTAGIRVIPFG